MLPQIKGSVANFYLVSVMDAQSYGNWVLSMVGLSMRRMGGHLLIRDHPHKEEVQGAKTAHGDGPRECPVAVVLPSIAIHHRALRVKEITPVGGVLADQGAIQCAVRVFEPDARADA